MKSRMKKTNREKTKKATWNARTVKVKVKYLRALRRAVGLHIDPDTAELYWIDAYASDPYGDYPDLPKKEKKEVGREYFARFSGSDLWVWLGDLPKATAAVLWKRIAKDHKYYCIYCGGNGGSGKLDWIQVGGGWDNTVWAHRRCEAKLDARLAAGQSFHEALRAFDK